ncbi:MAG: hypothetical protein HKL90_00125 [Elusimicrobia bacterium]|nr:hypothetical protein [Elusimicrobiota bacterium]
MRSSRTVGSPKTNVFPRALALCLSVLTVAPQSPALAAAVEFSRPFEPIAAPVFAPVALPTVPLAGMRTSLGVLAAPALEVGASPAALAPAAAPAAAAPATLPAQGAPASAAAPAEPAAAPLPGRAVAPKASDVPEASSLGTLAQPHADAAAGRRIFDNQRLDGDDAAVPSPTPSAAASVAPLAAAAPASAPTPAAPPARTAIASRIVVGPGTFQLKDFIDITDPALRARIQKAQAAKDIAKINLLIAAFTPLAPINAEMVYEARFMGPNAPTLTPAQRKAQVDAFVQALPQLLKDRVTETLRKNGAVAETVDGDITVYTVPDGVKFWLDLVNSPNPDERMAGLVFLAETKNSPLPDQGARIARGLNPGFDLKSQLLDARRFSTEDLAALGETARANGLQAARHGPYVLVGGGISFFVANAIFDAADALKDPTLAARFARVTRFVAAESIPIAYSPMPGAVAFYNPQSDEMNYVLPASSSASLNATAHELNHARFKRFLDDLKKWLAYHNFAIPFEIDGPSPFGPFGAFMTLLNELNSWRIGQSFDGGMKDKDILKVLLQSYGGEAGWDNVQRFAQVWTVSAIRGKSVPKLILERIRALNALDAAQLRQLGADAVARKDMFAAQNFLRLVRARYPKADAVPVDLAALVAQMKSFPDAGVVQLAQAVLPDPAPAAPVAAPAAPAAPSQAKAAFDADAVLKQLSQDSFLGMSDPAKVRTAKEYLLWLIAKRALSLDDPATPGRQAQALKLLSDLFDRWGFATLYGERALVSLNSMQQSMDKANGRPPSPEMRNRAVQKDHIFFSPWLVGMIAEKIFDGRPGNHRAGFLELLRSRVYPEEMVSLVKALAYFLTKDVRTQPTLNELMVARMFLSEPALEIFPTQRAWGDVAADAMRQDPAQFPGMLESLAEYYRIGLGAALPGEEWGRYTSVKLDAAQRTQVLAALGETAQRPEDWSRYEKARDALWAMLADKSPLARTAARYALAGHPPYLIGLENQLAAVLNGPPSPLRLDAVALAAMTRPGFLPALDAALARPDFAATADETRLLGPRQDADAPGLWKP